MYKEYFPRTFQHEEGEVQQIDNHNIFEEAVVDRMKRLVDMVDSDKDEFGDDSLTEANEANNDMETGEIIENKKVDNTDSEHEVMTAFKCLVGISSTEELRKSCKHALTAISTLELKNKGLVDDKRKHKTLISRWLTNQKAQKEEKKTTESKSFILERGVVFSALAIIGKGKNKKELTLVYCILGVYTKFYNKWLNKSKTAEPTVWYPNFPKNKVRISVWMVTKNVTDTYEDVEIINEEYEPSDVGCIMDANSIEAFYSKLSTSSTSL